LDPLLEPVALYPDPLLAQILTAATAPDDLSAAVKFLEDGGELGQVNAQPWNDNAKALTRYPEVLRMMNRSPDWTNAVGTAFLDQPRDVLGSIQRLRAEAVASGILQTTNEQRVFADKGIVCIYPADPTAMYLPQYDPGAVYAAGNAGPLTFGSGLLVGYWLHHEIDWRKQRVYSYDYREYPYGRRNPWYGGAQVSGEVPEDLPKQRNGEWKQDKKKARPRFSPAAPMPTIQHVSVPAEVLPDNEPPKPVTESRPLAAPENLPPPPPDLLPVDPAMESLDEAPAGRPPSAVTGAGKAAVTTPQPPKTAPAKPAAEKPVPARVVKAKPAETKPEAVKPAPAKPVKTSPAASTKPVPAKTVKENSAETKRAPAKSTKPKPTLEKSAAKANTGKTAAAEAKTSHAKKGKAEVPEEKPVKAKPSGAKTPSAKTGKEKPTAATAEKTKPAEGKSAPAKSTKAEPAAQKTVPKKSGKAKAASEEQR